MHSTQSKEAMPIRGHVKWYDTDKEYGFIRCFVDDKNVAAIDIFVHQNELKRSGIESLEKDQEVEFEIHVRQNKTHQGKKRAKKIKIVPPELAPQPKDRLADGQNLSPKTVEKVGDNPIK